MERRGIVGFLVDNRSEEEVVLWETLMIVYNSRMTGAKNCSSERGMGGSGRCGKYVPLAAPTSSSRTCTGSSGQCTDSGKKEKLSKTMKWIYGKQDFKTLERGTGKLLPDDKWIGRIFIHDDNRFCLEK